MSNVRDLFTKTGIDCKPVRTYETMARSIRLVQYPSGAQCYQGAYAWTEGFKGGVEWRDLPVIMVDSKGQEFTSD